MTDISLIMNLVATELQGLFARKKNHRGMNVFKITDYYADGFTFIFTNRKYRLKIEREDERNQEKKHAYL